MTIATRSFAAIAAVGAVLTLSACTSMLDTEKAQEEIGKQLAEQTNTPVADVSVSCPEDVDLEAGKSFDCDATGPNGEGTLQVKMTDDEGNITWDMGPEQLQSFLGEGA